MVDLRRAPWTVSCILILTTDRVRLSRQCDDPVYSTRPSCRVVRLHRNRNEQTARLRATTFCHPSKSRINATNPTRRPNVSPVMKRQTLVREKITVTRLTQTCYLECLSHDKNKANARRRYIPATNHRIINTIDTLLRLASLTLNQTPLQKTKGIV